MDYIYFAIIGLKLIMYNCDIVLLCRVSAQSLTAATVGFFLRFFSQWDFFDSLIPEGADGDN